MCIRAVSLAASVLALTIVASARADPPGSAVQLYASGNYIAAADAVAQDDDAATLAFASQALMAACVTTNDRSQISGWLDRAEESAREALERDPNSVDARMQLALVYGVRGRRANIADAVAHNYAPRGKRMIEEALAIEPNNARAHALLGAWHLEVIRRGGRAGAAAYGARLETGLREFNRARALAPDDPMIPLHFAIALIQLNPDRYGAQAAALLDASATGTPRDAFEAHALQVGRRIDRTLTDRGAAAAARYARQAFL